MKNVLIGQENMLGKASLRLCTTVEKEVQVGGSLPSCSYGCIELDISFVE